MANRIYGYTVVSYPESMPPDWRLQLNSLPFGYASCLHDKDVKVDDDGVIHEKKAHVHFFFQGKVTKRQKEYIHGALGVGYGEDVRSASGLFDYLTHEHNPDKYHYSKESIQYSEKWNQELFDCSYEHKPDMKELYLIIVRENITEYYQLLDWVYENDRTDLEPLLRQQWVDRYIRSRRHGRT